MYKQHSKKEIQSHRKDEHFFIAQKFYQKTNDNFKEIRFIHNGLPEIKLNEIDINPYIFNWKFPFYINAMTGGSKQTKKINASLAKISKETGIAMAVGSQNIAINYPELIETFKIVRNINPNGFIMGNISANSNLKEAIKAIKMINANALQIHINVAQEIVMPEGDKSFMWLKNISKIIKNINIPVIIKEVGFGMSKQTISTLKKIGTKYIDISGRGGTNFIQIENERRNDKDYSFLYNWGQSTIESLIESQKYQKEINIFASGGVKNPLDIIKCLRLGAKSVGLSGVILNSLLKNGEYKTIQMINKWKLEIIKIMAVLGAHNIHELRHKDIILSCHLLNYIKQRNLKII